MKLSDRVFGQEETHSHGKRDLEKGQNRRYAKNREENISKTRSSIEQEKKDYFKIIDKLENNLPDKDEDGFRYRHAMRDLNAAKSALELEDEKLENLEELESALKAIGDDLFQIPDEENTHDIGHHGANLARVSQINVNKKDITSARVVYGGKNQGLSYSRPPSGIIRTDRLIDAPKDGSKLMTSGNDIVTDKNVDEIFTKTITSGLGNVLRSKNPVIKKNAEVIVEMWNGFSDSERKGIDVFNVKQAEKDKMSPFQSTKIGGWGKRLYHDGANSEEKWLTRASSLTVLINDDDTEDHTRNTMLHEKSHKVYDDILEKNPEKVKKFTEDVLALGEEGAITNYALKHYENYRELRDEVDTKQMSEFGSAEAYEKALQQKANLYADEFHSNFIAGLVSPIGALYGYHDLKPQNIENANKLIKELYSDE